MDCIIIIIWTITITAIVFHKEVGDFLHKNFDK